nr:small hydrophobic protein [Dawn bat paramyxovirus]
MPALPYLYLLFFVLLFVFTLVWYHHILNQFLDYAHMTMIARQYSFTQVINDVDLALGHLTVQYP